ncbi:MAG: S-layer homology domain-containing protein [Acetivibrionales bacterium]
MKNLKKLFAVIVVVAMLATFMVPAFAAAPSDIEGRDCEDAVTRLVALGIITGRPDGTFAPDDTISRAEFAAVVVRALGYDTAAGAARGQTRFTDVTAEHWASGYINLANSAGIVNGRPDGTFGPNDPVQFEEAITMIVRALGYEPKAKALGGYPNGYLSIAAEKDITKDVSAIAGMGATRGDVAVMIDASLDVPMMVQSTWGEFPEYEEDEDKTLLSKLGVDEIKSDEDAGVDAIVTAVPNSDSSLDEDEIEIDGDVYTVIGTCRFRQPPGYWK